MRTRQRNSIALLVSVFSAIATQHTTAPRLLSADDSEVLSPEKWQAVDRSVNRALGWLASKQLPDGSFPCIDHGQPGVTSLCVLAFLANGSSPGEGPRGAAVNKAIDYVLSCQKQHGIIAKSVPDGPAIPRQVHYRISITSVYNHAISSLMLSEAWGSTGGRLEPQVQEAIQRALDATLAMQKWEKPRSEDRGGWRYLMPFMGVDTDLSVTGWQVQFLRSARNAGFDVPAPAIDDAVKWMRKSFNHDLGTFVYLPNLQEHHSRGMAGAGVLAMAHAGVHKSEEAQRTGEWILKGRFTEYNQDDPLLGDRHDHDRYHYALFNCAQGMYQLGGRYWSEFFPPVVEVLLKNQQADGSWPAERERDRQYGNAYSTALVALTLSAANEILSIYQR